MLGRLDDARDTSMKPWLRAFLAGCATGALGGVIDVLFQDRYGDRALVVGFVLAAFGVLAGFISFAFGVRDHLRTLKRTPAVSPAAARRRS